MNRLSYTLLLTLATVGCTAHLTDRIRETLLVETGSFNTLKARHIVEESLLYPTEEFSLSIQSGDPLHTAGGTYPLHLLKAEFIPLNERMIFAAINPLLGEIKPEFEFELLDNGQVRVFGRNGVYLADEIPFMAAEGLLTSNPIEYAVVSKKQKTSAVASFTPLPLTKALENKTISLTVNHPMLTRFWLTGDGFEPNQEITLCHTSGKQVEEIELIADEAGSISTELKPYVIGVLGGQAQVTVGDLILDYPWGTRLEKQTYEEKTPFPVLFVINKEPTEIDDVKIQKAFASYSISKGNE